LRFAPLQTALVAGVIWKREMEKQQNWFVAPSLKILLSVLLLWLVGMACLLLAMTNNFSASPFRSGNILVWLLLVFSSLIMLILTKNYYKSVKQSVVR
jgi:hypothetical protein